MSGSEWTDDLRRRLDELLDEHRAKMRNSLDGLTEEEARRSLVPSRTTLLGLVKHVTYVGKVWFNQALTGRSLRQLGAPSTPDRSFMLANGDILREQVLACRGRPAQTDAVSRAVVGSDEQARDSEIRQLRGDIDPIEDEGAHGQGHAATRWTRQRLQHCSTDRLAGCGGVREHAGEDSRPDGADGSYRPEQRQQEVDLSAQRGGDGLGR